MESLNFSDEVVLFFNKLLLKIKRRLKLFDLKLNNFLFLQKIKHVIRRYFSSIEFMNGQFNILNNWSLLWTIPKFIPLNHILKLFFQIVLTDKVLCYDSSQHFLIGSIYFWKLFFLNLKLPIADFYLFKNTFQRFNIKVHV